MRRCAGEAEERSKERGSGTDLKEETGRVARRVRGRKEGRKGRKKEV
jgi:hypothetical protein